MTETNTNVEIDIGLDQPSFITIETKRGYRHELTPQACAISGLITRAIENPNTKVITVDHETKYPINGVVSHIVNYMEHHNGREAKIPEKPLKSNDFSKACEDPWDLEFMNEIGKDRQLLYDILYLTNWFDIPCLLHLCCAKIATLIRGKELTEIKDIIDPTKPLPE